MSNFRCCIRSLCMAGLALAFIPITAPSVLGQEPAVGERIRVRTVSERPGKVTGVLETREPDYLVVQAEDATPTTIAWADISRLEVSRGTKSNVGKGALIGAGVGAGMGVSTVILFCTGESPLAEDCGAGEVVGTVAFLIGIGTGVGALIGAAARTEKWVEVPPNRWQIEVAPDPNGGVAVGVNLRL